MSSAPEPEPVPVSLSDASLVIGKGITYQIRETGGSSVTWTSSDEKVATVDTHGYVRGVRPGTCVVSAENDAGSRSQCEVTVRKTCYLSIDDGPSDSTPQLLAVLKKHHVKATFFLVDTYCLERCRDIHADGHLLALHAVRHIYRYCYRDSSGFMCDLDALNDAVEEYTGTRSRLMRFPGGTSNLQSDPLVMRRLVNGAQDLGYRVFDWTSSAGDTLAKANSDTSFRTVLESCTEETEIILMHDLSFTPEALDRLIPVLKRNGYVFETLDHYPERNYMHRCQYMWQHDDVPATDVELDRDELKLTVGEKTRLTARMTPDDSSDFVRWESTAPPVVSVAQNGEVTAQSSGEAYIFVYTTSRRWTGCRVTVEAAPAK